MSSSCLLIYPESVSDFKGVSEFSEHRKDKDVQLLCVCLSLIPSFISFPFSPPPPPRPGNVFVAQPSFLEGILRFDGDIYIYTSAKKKSW